MKEVQIKDKNELLQRMENRSAIYERELDILSLENHKLVRQNEQLKEQVGMLVKNIQNNRGQFQRVINQYFLKQKQYRQEIIILNSRVQSCERAFKEKGIQFGQAQKKILNQCKIQRQVRGQEETKREWQINQLRNKLDYQMALIRQFQRKQVNVKDLSVQKQKANVYYEISEKVFAISQQLNSLKLENDQLKFRNRVCFQQKTNLLEEMQILKKKVGQLIRQSKLEREKSQSFLQTIDEQRKIIQAKEMILNQLCQSIRVVQFEEYVNQTVRTEQIKQAEKLYKLLSQY